MRAVAFAVLVIFFCSACAEPPSREMNQAQGAIEAARAAGAEKYASTDVTAAVDALRRSEEAVRQNDYRLALSLAIESRQRAQTAAKTAVEARAKARGDAERAVAEVDTLLAHARQRLKDTPGAVPRRTLQGARVAIDRAEKSMQEARAALKADDYARVIQLTKGLSARVQAALETIDNAAAANRGARRQ